MLIMHIDSKIDNFIKLRSRFYRVGVRSETVCYNRFGHRSVGYPKEFSLNLL